MARTIDDAVAETRLIIQDDTVPYRTSDAELVRYLNNGLAETRRLRPDIWIGRTGGMYQIPTYDETNLNTQESFPLSDMYFSAVVNYMVSIQQSRDDQHVNDARAVSFMEMFRNQLRSG